MILLLLLALGDPRALGDRALADGDYATAARQYAEVRLDASANPGLRADIEYKRAYVAHLLGLRRLEHAAWIVLLGILSYFVIRGGRAPLELPPEIVFVAPIYALFIVAALGRDEAILRALLYVGAGSLLLIALAARGARRRFDAALLVAANLALFFAAANRAGLLFTIE